MYLKDAVRRAVRAEGLRAVFLEIKYVAERMFESRVLDSMALGEAVCQAVMLEAVRHSRVVARPVMGRRVCGRCLRDFVVGVRGLAAVMRASMFLGVGLPAGYAVYCRSPACRARWIVECDDVEWYFCDDVEWL